MNPRQLQQLAQDLRGQSLAQIDQELHRRHLDPETRIAVKHQLQTLGPARPPRRLTAEGLATDAAASGRPLSETERLLRRAGLATDRRYTLAQIDAALRQAGIEDPTQRLSLKLECEARGMLSSSPETSHPLHKLAERAGLLDEEEEDEEDATRNRQSASRGRTLRAAADRILRDAQGRPVVLRSVP